LTLCAYLYTLSHMDKINEKTQWSSLRVTKDFQARLREFCDAVGLKMSVYVMRTVERDMESKKSK
jgi:hypothetical protein